MPGTNKKRDRLLGTPAREKASSAISAAALAAVVPTGEMGNEAAGIARTLADTAWSTRKFMNTKEVAQRYGNGAGFWEKLRCAGGGPPYYLIGMRCYYDPTAVEEWLQTRKRTSTSDPGPDHAERAA